MNNIEILEEFIEQYNASYPEEKECVAIYPEQIEAIENLIQENKELKISNEMKKLFENNMLGYIKGYEDGRNGSTGLAYQVGNQFADYTLTLKLNKYKEDYLKARKLLDESIPKSKIKEKIEELEKCELTINICSRNQGKTLQQTLINHKIKVLQELLEE